MESEEYIKIAKMQAAADYGADVSVFDGGVHVVEAKEYASRARKTKTGKPFLDMTFFGAGLLAVADKSIMGFVTEYLRRCGRDLFRAFDAPNISELYATLAKHGYTVGEYAQAFLPSENKTKVICDDTGLKLETLYGSEISRLYEYKNFTEALCYDTISPRRDEIAVAYFDGDTPVAVAACSNDCDEMWQIGVDVAPDYRRHSLGSKLVAELTVLIEKAGKVPFYRCATSNIASRRTAYRAGYRDAWIELFSSRKNPDFSG